jgi:hypothetical protein
VSSAFFDVPGRGTGWPADRSVYPSQLRHIAAGRSASSFGRNTQCTELAGELLPPLPEHRLADIEVVLPTLRHLGDDRGISAKETCEGDDVPFQCALMRRGPCGEWLESNDTGASAERNPPQIYPPT